MWWHKFGERLQDSSDEVAGDCLIMDMEGQHDYNK